jgi:membrane protein implicated in regulation of membrane protease activity
MTLPSAVSNIALVVLGIALIVLARWAARKTGTRWESLVALRTGDVLFTEVVGAFLVGYAFGALVAPPVDRPGPPLPPGGGRFIRPGLGFGSGELPFTLGLIAAAIAALQRLDLRDLLLRGRGARNPLKTYIGWDARVVARIPAGGWGQVTLRDGSGNVMGVAATAASDIDAGTPVVIVGTQGRDLVVAPLDSARS